MLEKIKASKSDITMIRSAGLKRTDKANKAERLCFGIPFERRPGVAPRLGLSHDIPNEVNPGCVRMLR